MSSALRWAKALAKEKKMAALLRWAGLAEEEAAAAEASPATEEHLSMMRSREDATSLLRTRETISLPREWRSVRLLSCVIVGTRVNGVVALSRTCNQTVTRTPAYMYVYKACLPQVAAATADEHIRAEDEVTRMGHTFVAEDSIRFHHAQTMHEVADVVGRDQVPNESIHIGHIE